MKNIYNPKVIIKEASYGEELEGIIADILDELDVCLTGKKVLVKPNILGPFPPEQGVTTHPALLRSVVNQLEKRGAGEIIVGDNPGIEGYGEVKNAGKDSKLLEASNGHFKHIGDNAVRHRVKSTYFDDVLISKEILDADIIVNLPKLKTHVLCGFTGAIKNTYGYLVGGDKIRKHSLAKTVSKFAGVLMDVFQIRPPEINIMDAVVIMEGNGPRGGTLRTLNKIIASRDAITLDRFVVHFLGINIRRIPYLQEAKKRGLLENDISKIDISGQYSIIKNFRLPSTIKSNLFGFFWNGLLAQFVNTKPQINKLYCKVCKICLRHCPAKAISMQKKYPEIDSNKCLSCYCCYELCMEGAIRLKGKVLNKIKGK